MSRRHYRRHVPDPKRYEFLVNRGWAFSQREFSDHLDDFYDACSDHRQAVVIVIQPRTTAWVEFLTSTMVAEGEPYPRLGPVALQQITNMAKVLQKNCRARRKDIAIDATGGTIYGLVPDDAKRLAHEIVKLLRDPASFAAGKIVPLFSKDEDGAA